MKKITFIVCIALLGFGFTNPILSKKAPDAFPGVTADFACKNNANGSNTTCTFSASSGRNYQMIEYELDPSHGAMGAWDYDPAIGIDIYIYPHTSSSGTYARIYGTFGLVATLDISIGGVGYTYNLPHSQILGDNWYVNINNTP